MSAPRLIKFLLLCLALLLLEQVFSVYGVWQILAELKLVAGVALTVAVVAGLAHGLLLLAQLTRTLRRLKSSHGRPSAAVLRERRRIARDLHDLVGAPLVSALAMLDPADTRYTAQRAAMEHGLLELRHLVDTMDEEGRTLIAHLAQLRSRVEPALERMGAVLEWDVYAASLPEAPKAPLLALIAQEALSNVIQHSHATHVKVSFARLPDGANWQLEVADNGQGMVRDECDAAAAFGLRGMLERVQAVGGCLEVLQPEQGGTCVRATVPYRD